MNERRDANNDDLVAARLGENRAVQLRAELDAQGLTIVDQASLERLRSQAAGFARLQAMVEGPEIVEPSA